MSTQRMQAAEEAAQLKARTDPKPGSKHTAQQQEHEQKKGKGKGKAKEKCECTGPCTCGMGETSMEAAKMKCSCTGPCTCGAMSMGKTDAAAVARGEAKAKEEPAQSQPGQEIKMQNKPKFEAMWYKGSGKLQGKVALITGGDSGIGRAVAVLYAREGARVAINYLPEEQKDAEETKSWIEMKEGGECLLLPGNLVESKVCSSIVTDTVSHFGKLDILVNNAAAQHEVKDFAEITEEQINTTFRINIIAMMLTTKEALKHLPDQTGSIINTSSVNAFRGHPTLIDYTATKGAIIAFTRSLATQLGKRGIRVNAVAPGPIWTPLIASSKFKGERSVGPDEFGKDIPLGRCAQPEECSPSFVFLAAQDSSYFTGQTLHPNGGAVVNA